MSGVQCMIHNLRAVLTGRRWQRVNAASKAQGCPCGQPAEVAITYPVSGPVPYEWWTCMEHQGAELFGFDGKAKWRHGGPQLTGTKDDCPDGLASGWESYIGGRTTSYLCPHRTHVQVEEGDGWLRDERGNPYPKGGIPCEWCSFWHRPEDEECPDKPPVEASDGR